MFPLPRLPYILSCILAAGAAVPTAAGQEQPAPEAASDSWDLSPEIRENSPVWQRWSRGIPDILEDVKNDPSFATRIELGYTEFPSSNQRGGMEVGVEDIFLGRGRLTASAHYETSFSGNRQLGGGDLRYYLLPLGNYVNVAPAAGYRHFSSGNYSVEGLNLGLKVMVSLSRTGAADIGVSQSFISPGGAEEVGLTEISAGYAITSKLRLAANIKKQNSRVEKDSSVGISLEWLP